MTCKGHREPPADVIHPPIHPHLIPHFHSPINLFLTPFMYYSTTFHTPRCLISSHPSLSLTQPIPYSIHALPYPSLIPLFFISSHLFSHSPIILFLISSLTSRCLISFHLSFHKLASHQPSLSICSITTTSSTLLPFHQSFIHQSHTSFTTNTPHFFIHP